MTNILLLLPLLTCSCTVTTAAAGSNALAVSPNRRLDTLTDFSIGDTVAMAIDSTDKQFWTVDMSFLYGGNMAETTVSVLDWDCTTVLPPGLISPAETPLTFGADDLTVHLDVNFGGSQNNGVGIWTQGEEESSGQLAFCVRVELYFDGVFVNFAATQTTINVDTSGEFLVFQDEATVRSAVGLFASTQVTIGYQVVVYPCDMNAQPVLETPTFSPGKAIRLCVSLADSDAHQNVYVSSIQSLSYSSGDASLEKIDIVIDGVTQNQLVLLDCTQLDGGEYSETNFEQRD